MAEYKALDFKEVVITSSKHFEDLTEIAMNKQILGLVAVALLVHSGVNAMEYSDSGPVKSTGRITTIVGSP